jgi:hypothetical protein
MLRKGFTESWWKDASGLYPSQGNDRRLYPDQGNDYRKLFRPTKSLSPLITAVSSTAGRYRCGTLYFQLDRYHVRSVTALPVLQLVRSSITFIALGNAPTSSGHVSLRPMLSITLTDPRSCIQTRNLGADMSCVEYLPTK